MPDDTLNFWNRSGVIWPHLTPKFNLIFYHRPILQKNWNSNAISSFMRGMFWSNKILPHEVSYYKSWFIGQTMHYGSKIIPPSCSASFFTLEKNILWPLKCKYPWVSYYTRLFDPDPFILERRATYHSKALDLIFRLRK